MNPGAASRPAVLVENASLNLAAPVGGSLATLEQMAATAGDGPALLLIGDALARAASEAEPAIADNVQAIAS